MTELVDPQKGEPISSAQQRELVRLGRRKFTGPNVIETPDGFHVRDPVRIKPITVVVVVKPLTEHTTLTVRKVIEKKDPPEAVGDYEWAKDPFEAYPDFGRKAVEYDEFYLASQSSLGITTKFLRARRARSIWKVEYPSAASSAVGFKFATIVSETEDSGVLLVQYVDGGGAYIGSPETALVWPKMKGRDWRTFVDTDIVVLVAIHDGLPYVMQLPRWYMRTDPGGLPGGDCPL